MRQSDAIATSRTAEEAQVSNDIPHTYIGYADGRHFQVIVVQFSGGPTCTTFPEKHTTARHPTNDTNGAPIILD